MSQDYEFDVLEELDELDFIVSISLYGAAELGYRNSEHIERRYSNNTFNEKFDDAVESDSMEFPAVASLSLAHPEELDIDFDTMMNQIEDIVREYGTVNIGSSDAGVPADDWSGWKVDPTVDILIIR